MLEDPAFQGAFVATTFLFGGPLEPLAAFATPAPSTLELLRQLGSEDRTARARAVAQELERVARCLDRRRLAWG